MLNKKNDKLSGKCPFRKLKTCSRECVLFREGVRYTEDGSQTFPFCDCALNIIADNLEAMHNRAFMMQKEVGETKNVMALKILSDMGFSTDKEVIDKTLKMANIEDSSKKMIE